MVKYSRFVSPGTLSRLPRWHHILCGLLTGLLALVVFLAPSAQGPVAHAAPPAPTGNGLGEEAWYTYWSQRLDDRMELKVNVADGNLIVHAVDLHIRGTGLDLNIERFYNSLSATATDLGAGWVLNTGADVNLVFNQDGSVTFNALGGYAALYVPDGTGGYTDAPGLDATLLHQVDGTWRLTFHRTGLRFNFSSAGRITNEEDKNQNHINFTYNDAGRLTAITDTQGRVTSFTSDSAGRITKLTDPTGRTTTYTYDSNNNLVAAKDLAGKTTTFAYTGSTLTQITDPNGHITQCSYDTLHRVTSILDATGASTTFTYNTGSTVLTDANNHQTTYSYDSQNRVTQTVDALGHAQSTTWTSDDNVQQVTDALTQVTTLTYDAKNNLTSATEPTTANANFTYTDSTHPYFATSTTDPQAHTLAYTYDTPGNPTTTTDGLSTQNTVSQTYNTNGTVASQTDGDGHTTTYSYDSKGNLTTITPPIPLGTLNATYDGLSRVITLTDGRGQTTSVTYDAMDRITKFTYADGSQVSYTYDSNGNLISMVDTTGTTTFTYDQDNRLLQKTLPNLVNISATYDGEGNLTSFTDSSGTVHYAYNAVNLLTTLTEPNGAQTSYTYDADDRKTGTSYPNGVAITYTYDTAGHLTSITTKHGSTTLASFSYTYINPTTQQATDLRYSVTDASNNVTTYTYDALNRLTEAKTNNGSTLVSDYVYTYDGAGNRTSMNANGVTTSYAYNAANELTSTTTGGATITYSYDADGNPTGSSAGLALTYNAASQTTAVNGVSQAYTGANQTERVQAGSVSFVNSPLGVSSQADSTGTTYFTRDNQNNLLDERTPSGTYYYVFDGLSSVIGLTDSSGALVKTYAYDPYGNVTATTGSVTNPWRFASGYADASSGYIKFGARYDDPTLGRWTQEDPMSSCILRPTSLNRYSYVSDEPINATDPSGLLNLRCFFWCIAVEAGPDCADTCLTAVTPGNAWFITAWYLFLCSQCAGHALHYCRQLCGWQGGTVRIALDWSFAGLMTQKA